jgi:hypothetical protein
MQPYLKALRYDDLAYAGTAPAEMFDSIADLGARWSLPGGLQKLQLTIKGKSRADVYERYRDHLGHRIAVYDSLIDRYIAGQVYEIITDGNYVDYICAGGWRRFNDLRYDKGDRCHYHRIN